MIYLARGHLLLLALRAKLQQAVHRRLGGEEPQENGRGRAIW